MPRGGQQKSGRPAGQPGWGGHMLSGVPFELRWKPRRLPSLPESPPPVRPELLASWTGRDYNFALEHRVLYPPEAAVEEEAAKKRLEQDKAQAIEPDSNAVAKSESEKSSKSSKTNDNSLPSRKNGYMPPPAQSHSTSVSTFNLSKDPLKPQPVTAPSTANLVSNTKAALNITSIKDFDRVDDPFDEAELRTIDDMAELKNVLSGFSARGCAVDISDECSSSGGGQSNRSPVASVHEISFPKLSLGPDSPISSESPKTLTTMTTSNGPPHPPPPPASTVSTVFSSAPLSVLPVFCHPTPPPPPHQKFSVVSTASMSICPLSHPPLPHLSLMPPPSQPSSVITTAPMPVTSSLMHSQPTRSILGSSITFGGSVGASSANVRSSSYPELASAAAAKPTQSTTTAKPNNPAQPVKQWPCGPDPYPELGVLERVKADSLCSMGFPRDRAARAVARLGLADAELIAYLCGVDRVVEACGVSPLDAENAIRMLGSEAKAIRYLPLRTEMLEFGFNNDDIEAAALEANLDRDGTVSLLLKRNGLSL